MATAAVGRRGEVFLVALLRAPAVLLVATLFLAPAVFLAAAGLFLAPADFRARVGFRAARARARLERAVFFDFLDDARFDAARLDPARFFGLMIVSSRVER
jgi:hypothetical protein